MFTPLAPLALAALVFLREAQAALPALYVGCVDASFAPSPAQTIYTAASASQCASYCYNVGGGPYTYAYYLGDTSQCTCANEAPAISLYVASPDTSGAASCSTSQFFMQASVSSYTFDGCYSGIQFTDDDTTSLYQGTLANPEACLSYCKAYQMASFYQTSSGFECACGSTDDFTLQTAGACGPNRYYFATHEAGTAVSSQFAKRQARERLIKTRSEREALCPGSLHACNVPGAFNDSFECIDTTSELESCGGCAQGFFNDRDAANATLGVDCSSLPGVAKGAVTCTSGVCEAFACQRGYTLTNGVCVQA
ncbi:hypothetical protein I317_01726 [Kwoniella heveanensis CBS 569]|uniref:Protein CPL1-like domain-containing protein n=1 Tax=Kwoniella heveanensis BCC8398 TaxID=1296120 RepID=A0A1B9GST4_9TREE|nr:hypothetical protein I316_04078 [Kwoniella heveanensis BCC8398]OCF44465.1 hypothetical protein I317_01726 [Kwoniella heveanensis CBS 569]